MAKVRMLASRELLEQILDFGDRRIVGVEFVAIGGSVEPTAQLAFTVEAPDAPEGVTQMCPTYQRRADGTIAMLDPGWG